MVPPGPYPVSAVRIVAVLNQKGGVGKTTTAVNLGAALALRGRRVLLIDADPQGNLSDHLGVDPGSAERSIYDVLTDDLPIADAIRQTETERLFLVPSQPDLAAAEQELAGEIGREMRLRRAVAQLPDDAFDWVFIDCPPSLGLLSLNAMAVATELIVTVQTQYFAMRGLGQLDQTVQLVHEHVNPKLGILGILATLVNPVTKLSKDVVQEIRAHYGDLVFRTHIRQNVRLAEAPGYQNHIFAYEPLSPGAEDYAALADEVEERAGVSDSPAATEPVHPVAPEPVAPEPLTPEPERPEAGTPDAEPDAPAGPERNGDVTRPAPAVEPNDAPVRDAPPTGEPPADARAATRPDVASADGTPPSHDMPRADRPRASGERGPSYDVARFDVAKGGRIIMPPPIMPM